MSSYTSWAHKIESTKTFENVLCWTKEHQTFNCCSADKENIAGWSTHQIWHCTAKTHFDGWSRHQYFSPQTSMWGPLGYDVSLGQGHWSWFPSSWPGTVPFLAPAMQSSRSGACDGVQSQIHQHTNSGHVARCKIWQNVTIVESIRAMGMEE